MEMSQIHARIRSETKEKIRRIALEDRRELGGVVDLAVSLYYQAWLKEKAQKDQQPD